MFKLEPIFKDYLWGGNKLVEKYNKKSTLSKTAESWELSTHKDGLALIDDKNTLLSYVEKFGKSVLGSKCSLENDLPILIKFIDAKDALSIQVHPDDDFALKNENDFGKTEMWYIVEAEPDAKLIYGFKEDITKDEFKKAIETNTLEDLVNEISVSAGDVFFISPGTMHAIGKGIVIAEIQQCSNVTYRIYDFGRLGLDGNPRELHIEKALAVTNLNACVDAKVNYSFNSFGSFQLANLAKCKYFNVDLINIIEDSSFNCDETSFNCLTLLDGSCKISNNDKIIEMKKGDSVFIPANSGEYLVSGKSTLICSSL